MSTPRTKKGIKDPYASDPGAGRPNDSRLAEGDAAVERAHEADVPSDELPATTRTGQTSRGGYATDPATGAGGYRDHTGTFTTDPVAGTDPDDARDDRPIDPQL